MNVLVIIVYNTYVSIGCRSLSSLFVEILLFVLIMTVAENGQMNLINHFDFRFLSTNFHLLLFRGSIRIIQI